MTGQTACVALAVAVNTAFLLLIAAYGGPVVIGFCVAEIIAGFFVSWLARPVDGSRYRRCSIRCGTCLIAAPVLSLIAIGVLVLTL